jgi:chromosome partitioning protein
MEDDPRIIALLNQKGGVGKTTTTVNLGAALADRGKRVLLVDLDPQAHLTLHLGVELPEGDDIEAGSVYDLLLDGDLDPGEAVQVVEERLHVIPSEVDLAAAEVELAGEGDRYLRLREHLRRLANDYDHVLLDCPPSLGLLTINGLACAHEVIVPMQAHFLALQGVSKLLDTVSMMAAQVNPNLRVSGVVLCMHESTTKLAGEVVADLETFFEQSRDAEVPWRGARVLQPHIRRNIKLAEAPSFGQSIFQYEPSCAGAQDYAALASNILSMVDEEPAAAAARDDTLDDEEVCTEVVVVTEQVDRDYIAKLVDTPE